MDKLWVIDPVTRTVVVFDVAEAQYGPRGFIKASGADLVNQRTRQQDWLYKTVVNDLELLAKVYGHTPEATGGWPYWQTTPGMYEKVLKMLKEKVQQHNDKYRIEPKKGDEYINYTTGATSTRASIQNAIYRTCTKLHPSPSDLAPEPPKPEPIPDSDLSLIHI